VFLQNSLSIGFRTISALLEVLFGLTNSSFQAVEIFSRHQWYSITGHETKSWYYTRKRPNRGPLGGTLRRQNDKLVLPPKEKGEKQPPKATKEAENNLQAIGGKHGVNIPEIQVLADHLQSAHEDENTSYDNLKTEEEFVQSKLKAVLDHQEVEERLLGLDLVDDNDDFLCKFLSLNSRRKLTEMPNLNDLCDLLGDIVLGAAVVRVSLSLIGLKCGRGGVNIEDKGLQKRGEVGLVGGVAVDQRVWKNHSA
jgi:hypothetical protein